MVLRAKKPSAIEAARPRILIYGKGGVGKTFGALSFPDCYYIDSEGGATREQYAKRLEESGGVYMGLDEGAGDLKTIVAEIRTLATTKHDYRTLVIDSFTRPFMGSVTLEYDRLAKYRDMSKSFGSEKKPAVALTKQMLVWLTKLDMNVIIVCHERALWQNNEQVGFTFDGHDKLEYDLDLVLRCINSEGKRLAVVGKTRIDSFKEGEAFPWDCEHFAEKYGKEIVVRAHQKVVTPATKDQVTELLYLIQRTKLDEKTQLKWCDKAGIIWEEGDSPDWSQMDTVTIQKCIEHLEN